MDKKFLQNTILESAYNREVWIDVLKEYFGLKKVFQQPLQISVDRNKAEYAVELGNFRTADEREKSEFTKSNYCLIYGSNAIVLD
ncbi:MAG: hypothetical protein IPJ45_17700 [Ignavibacteria bacterium]|nr:hypothetical protein [Ignavibacteria bacterium]